MRDVRARPATAAAVLSSRVEYRDPRAELDLAPVKRAPVQRRDPGEGGTALPYLGAVGEAGLA